MFDLHPPARELSRLVSGVRDDQLGHPTPCSAWSVADLLAHVHQLATFFTGNARARRARPPDGLVADWRRAIPDQLDALARAWGEESAWRGRMSAGGVEMDAADNALVVAEELTVHGWDLAHATGQVLQVGDASLDLLDRFFDRFGAQFSADGSRFATAVATVGTLPRLDAAVARSGRDPAWGSAGTAGEQVCATRAVRATAQAVFAVLADPSRHAAIDGTGWVTAAVDTATLARAGQTFRMAMFHPDAQQGHYETVNQVLVVEPPRVLSWRTGYRDEATGGLVFGGWWWRYDLTPGNDGTTRVTLTYDWSEVGPGPRQHLRFPPFPPDHLAGSLHHLAELVGDTRVP